MRLAIVVVTLCVAVALPLSVRAEELFPSNNLLMLGPISSTLSPDARVLLGLVVAGRCEEAGALFNSKVRGDDPDIVYTGGNMFVHGACVQQDVLRGMKLIVLAANKGSRDAIADLGMRYGLGIGVPQDYVSAGQWFRKIDDGAHADAVNDYALGYGLTRRGVAQSILYETDTSLAREITGAFGIRIDLVSQQVTVEHDGVARAMRAQSILIAAILQAWADAGPKLAPPDVSQMGTPPLLYAFIRTRS